MLDSKASQGGRVSEKKSDKRHLITINFMNIN